jgi:hypothetical protein
MDIYSLFITIYLHIFNGNDENIEVIAIISLKWNIPCILYIQYYEGLIVLFKYFYYVKMNK